MANNTKALLNNRYKIIQSLGRGGFGETFLAIDTYLPSKRKCVIKQLKPSLNESLIPEWMCERFEQEARILESLGSKQVQIPQLYAYFQEGNNFYLIQEWIDGITLTQKVEKEGTLSVAQVEYLLVRLLPVLDYIHKKNIVHRDIKPDNIIFRSQDQLPVLIDFGAVKDAIISSMSKRFGHSAYSIAIGTPGYMASEQAAGRPIFSSDLYSLGLTAVFLLTGKHPQSIETDTITGEILWRQEIPELHSHLASIIDRTVRFNPRERFTSAREMLDALQSEQTFFHSSPSKALLHKNNPTSNYSKIQTKAVIPRSRTRYKLRRSPKTTVTTIVNNKTKDINQPHLTTNKQATTVADTNQESFSVTMPAFFPWLFLCLIGITSVILGYQFVETMVAQDPDDGIEVVENAPPPEQVDEEPQVELPNKIRQELDNIVEDIDETINEKIAEKSNSDQAPSAENSEQSDSEVTPSQPNSNNQQKPEVKANPEPPQNKPKTKDVSSFGLSAQDLTQKWGQPSSSYPDLAHGDRVKVLAYDNPQPNVKQIKYLVSNQNNQVVQVEIVVSSDSSADQVAAQVNQSMKTSMNSHSQSAIAEVVNGQTDLRSFKFGNYQGMIQKRNQRLEIRVWDRQSPLQ